MGLMMTTRTNIDIGNVIWMTHTVLAHLIGGTRRMLPMHATQDIILMSAQRVASLAIIL